MASDLPRQLPDRMVRDSLRKPANLRDFLVEAFPEEAPLLDIANAQLVEGEMIGGDWRARDADLLFDIPHLQTPEKTSRVAVLIEHQSDTDPLMPLRTLLIITGYWDRVWREWEESPKPRAKLELPPVLAVVLYTGDVAWGSNETLRDMLGPPAALHAFTPDWGPVFWNLSERTPDQLLVGGAWMQFMAVMRVSHEEQAEIERVFTEAIRQLNKIQPTEHVRWYELLRMIYKYAVWRSPREARPALEQIVLRENPANYEEVKAMAKTGGEELMDLGAARQMRRLIRAVLTPKFGPVPDAVAKQLEATTDIERLEAAFARAQTAQKLEEFEV